ncbi:hypothetical protein CYY_002813 [Polysphondylium violaceum]|uniref:DEAD/DEAH box helicase n=1 Tax=Polysphondylium violaceum TaxID=133409 RepID=A0A8J4PZJ9_9MYCE|nr:hypothetical protein CYY_002813 [Polysphondylium violaceum]
MEAIVDTSTKIQDKASSTSPTTTSTTSASSSAASSSIPFNLLFPNEAINILHDFGVDLPFVIDGDSLILHLFLSNPFLSTTEPQSLVFFHYFENFISTLLNRKARFHILFIQENESLYKNSNLRLIRKLCIQYYIYQYPNKYSQEEHQVTFKLIRSKWWDHSDYLSIETYFKENMFSFMFIRIPENLEIEDQVYDTYMLDSLILKSFSFFDYIVELNSVAFNGSNVASVIYAKSFRFERFLIEKQNDYLSTVAERVKSRDDISSYQSTMIDKQGFEISLFTEAVKKDRSISKTELDYQFITYICLKESLSLQDRSIKLPDSFKPDQLVSSYLSNLSSVMCDLLALGSESVLQDIDFLDLIDYKLFVILLSLVQGTQNADVYTIVGKDVSEKVCHIWSLVHPGLPVPLSAPKIPALRKVIRHIEKETIGLCTDIKVDKISNDFIEHVSPNLGTLFEPYYSDDSESDGEGDDDLGLWDDDSDADDDRKCVAKTRFVDNFHFHRNKTIEPDAFDVKLKDAYKETRSRYSEKIRQKGALAFKKYADSLNDPKDKFIITHLVSKEEQEKARLKMEKEELKKTYHKPSKNKDNNNKNKVLKPKDEAQKRKENALVELKARFLVQLETCSDPSLAIKFLSDTSNLLQLTKVYEKFFDKLVLFKDNLGSIKSYYQLIQGYLRFFDENSTFESSSIFNHMYFISKNIICSYDLANYLSSRFRLGHSELDIHSSENLRDSIKLQMVDSPETLVRNTGSVADKRVRNFKPDKWQVELLDIVDAQKSALICAPTSSGKTFISFYAFESVLKSSNDGIVVFVCPTKALVNQMYAEVLGKYEKNYNHILKKPSSHRMVGIFTREWRLDIHNCQILITVAEALEILFLSVVNTSFIQRIKYVIFDEVHTIASASGAVWERLLLFNPSPFLALSATIGNLKDFHEWLKKIDPNRDVELIQYKHRFNDLNTFFVPPSDPTSIEPIHPVSCLLQDGEKIIDFGEDHTLLSNEAYELYAAMKDRFGYQMVQHLDPCVCFASKPNALYNLEKQAIYDYQLQLKETFTKLSKSHKDDIKKIIYQLSPIEYKDLEFPWMYEITGMLIEYQKKNLLPIIIFTFDRKRCNNIADTIYQQILSRNTDPDLQEKKYKLDASIKVYEKLVNNIKKNQSSSNETIPEMKILEDLRNKRNILDYSKPQFGTLTLSDIDQKVRSNPMAQHLMQGIAVHHAGCDKNYLKNVEYLFRSGKIQVVIGTSTLALGVNMPCKSVMFCGDSPYLNTLTFRQCAGRAGRRGIDKVGNTIFVGVSHYKINNLLNSNLSQIVGNTCLSPSISLQLLCRYDYELETQGGSKKEKGMEIIKKSTISLLNNSFFIGDPIQVQFQFRFSLDYLYKSGFINKSGVPLDYSGIVTHLSYLEPYNFLFVLLLTQGAFDNVHLKNQMDSDIYIIKILSHLFCIKKTISIQRRSPSILVLEQMPKEAYTILEKHNVQLMENLYAYIHIYQKYLNSPPLALSHDRPIKNPENTNSAWRTRIYGLKPTKGFHQNPVHSLCGAYNIKTKDQLKSLLGSKNYFSLSVLPFSNLEPGIINSYILDFFKHGQSIAIIRDNKISEGEIWNLLREFTLVLKTIATCLERRSEHDPITLAFKGLAERYQKRFGESFSY